MIVGEASVVIKADARGFDKSLEKNLTGTSKAAGSADKELKNFTQSSIGARRFAGALTTQAGLLGAGLGAAGLGGAAAVAAAAIGQKFVGAIGSAVAAASNLNEQTNKARVVFGDASEEVLKFGAQASDSIGQSERQALEAAGTFGNLFRAIGLTEGASAGMSVQLVKLASDIASFNNSDPADALLAIRAGLVGEAEPLRRFGVQLSEARIKQEALNQGLIKGTQELDAASRAQASYAIIQRDTVLAQGDFARTSGDLANSQRTLKARSEELQANLGKAFTPAVTQATGALSDAAGAVVKLDERLATNRQSILDQREAFLRGITVEELYAQQTRDAADAVDELQGHFIGIAKLMNDNEKAAVELALSIEELTKLDKEQQKIVDEKNKAIDETNRSQLELIKAQRQSQDAGIEYTESLEDVSEAQQNIGITAKQGRDGILDAKRAVEDSKQAYDDARFRVEDLTEALENQREANERLKASVPRAEFDLTRAREGQTSAVDDLKDAEAELRDIRRFVSTTPQQIQEAEERVRQARLGVQQASFGTEDAEQRLADLREEIADGPERIAEAERDIARARQSLIDQGEAVKAAELGVGEARRLSADNSAEANDRLNDAQRRVEDSAFGVAQASVDLAREQAEAGGKTLTSAQANDIYRASLNKTSATLDPKSPLRVRLKDYAEEIKTIPLERKTTLKIDNADANKKLDETQKKLDKLIEGLAGTATSAIGGGDGISGGIEGATINIQFESDIEGTAKAVLKGQNR